MRRQGKLGSTPLFYALLALVLFLAPARAGAAEKEAPFLFTFFKTMISSTDGKRCSHVPSCARYAKDAVVKHGILKGGILTCDRLLRCGGDDLSRLPMVSAGEKVYAWDPVSANDFWWGENSATRTDPRNDPDFLTFENWE